MKIFKNILAGVTLAISAIANAYTGNELLADIQREDFMYSHGYSNGYVAGVFNTSFILQGGINICFPDNVTIKQGIDVVKKYLQSTPEERHLDGSVLIYSAFLKAWPCPKRPVKK